MGYTPAAVSTPSARSWLFLALMMVALTIPQIVVVMGRADMHVDGGYYMDVAMHVRDGHGLVSDVSLYHAGVPEFPYPTPIYPLWPTVLGLAGRVADITVLGHWLPFAFWLASLVGAWAFGRRLYPGDLFGVRGLDSGHLLALMLGVQKEYSRFTTMPYTEGLAMALLMGMLWRLTHMRGRLRDGLELGVWLTLLCTTRSQMFIAPIAVGMALGAVAVAGGREGRRWVLPGAAALAVVGAALFVWWKHSAAFVLDASPLTLLRFDQARVSDVLSPIDVLKDHSGPVDLVLDRLGGVIVAWNPFDWIHSYARGFLASHWALPVALVAAVPALRRLWPPSVGATALRDALRDPRAFAWITVILLSLGALASIHLPHKEGFGDWYFHRRHAIVCVLPFFVCLGWLARQPWKLGRIAALVIAVSNIGLSAESLYYRVERALEPEPLPYVELVDWLEQRSGPDDPLIVAVMAFAPPELAWRTDHIGYHWFYERTELADLELMVTELGASYIIFNPSRTNGWAFRDGLTHIRERFVAVKHMPDGLVVYRLRPSTPAAFPSRKDNAPGG